MMSAYEVVFIGKGGKELVVPFDDYERAKKAADNHELLGCSGYIIREIKVIEGQNGKL